MGQLLKLLLLLGISRSPLSGAAAASTTGSGIQANFGDVTFAGGMSFDSEHQILYVTGQVGPHSCFVGILKRVSATTSSNHPTHLEFLSRQIFDERSICQTIAFRKDVTRPGNALLLGLSEEGGLLTDQREEGSRRATQYGALLNLEYSADGSSSEFNPEKSVLMYPAAVTVPRSITNDPTRTNRVFVATMTSDSTDIQYRDALGSPHVSEGGGGGVTTKPNLTPGGGMLKYGKNFAMTVESIRLATEFSSAEPQWRKPFGVRRNSDKESGNGVTVNQIIFRQDKSQEGKSQDKAQHALYVVGSTLGSGPAFGVPEFENDQGYGVIAGFITKLDPDTGKLAASRRFLFNTNGNGSPLPDTYIEAVCDATDDDDAIYIVGSYDRIDDLDRLRLLQNEEGIVEPDFEREITMTAVPTGSNTWADSMEDTGELDDDFDPDDVMDDDFDITMTQVPTDTMTSADTFFDDDFDDNDDNVFENDEDNNEDESPTRNTIATPFIAKLRASTLETIWQKDFDSTANARALGCGVDAKSKAVYLAGNVENGGELVGQTTSMLGDDVFLLRLDTSNGNISWSKQIGTSSDDRLAYGGSGLVVLEGEQGVVLMGDTTSDLYSVSNQDSEIFIVEIDADGNVPDTTESNGIDNSPEEYLVKVSNPTKISNGETSDPPNSKPKRKPKNDDSTDPSNNDDSEIAKSRVKGHSSYIVASVCIVAFAVVAFYVCKWQKKKREAAERALVFSYLQGFDLEDIDVKQAATGGWHGTYIGSLAEGLNVLDSENRSDSDGSWNSGSGSGDQKLSKLSHSSVVKDILFMDYDDAVFSSVDGDKSEGNEDQTGEKDGIIRDTSEIVEGTEEENDDRKVDPWGTEII